MANAVMGLLEMLGHEESRPRWRRLLGATCCRALGHRDRLLDSGVVEECRTCLRRRCIDRDALDVAMAWLVRDVRLRRLARQKAGGGR